MGRLEKWYIRIKIETDKFVIIRKKLQAKCRTNAHTF